MKLPDPAHKLYFDYLTQVLEQLEDLAMDSGATARLLSIETDYKQAVEHAIETNKEFYISDTMLSLSEDAFVLMALETRNEIHACIAALTTVYHQLPESRAGEN